MNTMRHGTTLAGALALLVASAGCTATAGSDGTSATRQPADLTGTVGIRDLHDRFVTDRAGAEEACYGHSVTVRAVVLKTGASEYGTPTIEASDVADGTHLASIVLPYDDRRAQSFRELENVKAGQEIVASATCNVFVERNNVLIFKNSEIVK